MEICSVSNFTQELQEIENWMIPHQVIATSTTAGRGLFGHGDSEFYKLGLG